MKMENNEIKVIVLYVQVQECCLSTTNVVG